MPGPSGFPVRVRALTATLVLLSALAWSRDAAAQQRGDHIAGFNGLQAGTQAPPGIYAGYLLWVYPTDTIKDGNGDRIGNGDGGLTSSLNGALVQWVLNFQIAGGHVGGTLGLPWIRNRIQANALDIDTGLAFTDTILTPVSVGWHKPRTDYLASYTLYLPTGRFEPGGTDNAGLGMLGQELSFGVTQHFDARKSWHAAGILGYEWHTKKKDLDLRVGQIMTIEGGFGKTFYKKVNNPVPLITNIGVVGYGQFKVTEDSGSDRNPIFEGQKDRVFGLGPEVNVYIPQARLAIVGRVIPEFGARLRTQGTTIVLTVAYTAKSLVAAP